MSKSCSILALHGFTGSGEDFKGFSPLCHAVDAWHCPDLPGHGPAPQLDCTPEATVAFIQDPFPTQRILLGYSMGARAALQHAVAHPEHWKALILVSPNPGIDDAKERADRRLSDEALAQRIERDGTDAFLEYWQQTPLIRSQQNIRPDWRQSMQASRAKHSAEGLAASLRQFGQGNCPNLWPELNKLSMPILLITGSEDTKYTAIAKRMLAQLPASHASIEGASHAPQFESPETCAGVIDDFIRQV